MAFSEKLYELRKKRGLSQEELAEALDVSRQAISKWESGRALPEAGKLLTVSEYFGVSLDELMKEDAPPLHSAPEEKNEPETKEPETKAPEKGSLKKRTLGLIVCIGGLVCLILFGLLFLLFPASSEDLAASSVIRLDGRGIVLGLCVLAAVTGAVLLLKNATDK
jgi:transcriptional regulator with XRE-family HTH domain